MPSLRRSLAKYRHRVEDRERPDRCRGCRRVLRRIAAGLRHSTLPGTRLKALQTPALLRCIAQRRLHWLPRLDDGPAAAYRRASTARNASTRRLRIGADPRRRCAKPPGSSRKPGELSTGGSAFAHATLRTRVSDRSADSRRRCPPQSRASGSSTDREIETSANVSHLLGGALKPR